MLCIYHGNCADGFGAAFAIWKKYGDDITYYPAVYGDAPPDVTGLDVFIVDFSYKRPVLTEMASKARSILVLDHHKTAQADGASLWSMPRCFSHPKSPANYPRDILSPQSMPKLRKASSGRFARAPRA